MMTTVINLATQDELVYSLPPERAVVVAYMVQTKRNHNWWGYDWSIVKTTESGAHVYCGDFAAATGRGQLACILKKGVIYEKD